MEIKLNTYRILADAVESGVALGWNRSHKHEDDPDPIVVRERIVDSVMEILCEVVDFGQ